MVIFTLSPQRDFQDVDGLNQMYLYGWSSRGSSKKIVKECMNIVITLYDMYLISEIICLLGKHLVYKFTDFYN